MSDAEPRVWEAGEEDLPQVAELLGEFRAWFGSAPLDRDRMLASVARIRTTGEGLYLLAAFGDGPSQGVCQLRFRWSVWTDCEDAWLEDLFVRERSRGAGLARALIEAAIESSRERGCARIELDVDEANSPALELYRSVGFAGDLKAQARSLLLGLRIAGPDQAARRSAASRADSSA